jgi:phage gp29-like protein
VTQGVPGGLGPPNGSTGYPGLGAQQPNTNDPAFQPIADPLKDGAALRQRALTIHREIPNVVIQQGWQVADVRTALQDLTVGLFDRPSQLQDTIASDSRVQSAMRSRSGGLLSQPLRFKPAKHPDKDLAKKACRLWERHWPAMHPEPALLDLLETTSSLGFAYDQILWDTGGKTWLPYLQPFNARYSYYHWVWRVHVAVTLDGQYPITGGDGHWVLHAPYGTYRGWMRGALRALAQWWLARNYALRDWAAYCEKHGFPTVLADTPFGGDPNDINAFTLAISNLGQDNVIQLPGNVDPQKYGKYDLRYLEPQDQGWQSFKALIEQCNDEITLALLGQNLTSQVKEGSLAAARVHADVRQAILEADARALARTLYVQVARPFAALNYGDPDLAPRIVWDVSPPEDQKTNAQTAQSLGMALNFMRLAGIRVKDPVRMARRFGIELGDVEHVDPTQVESKIAQSTGSDGDVAEQQLDDHDQDDDSKDDSNRNAAARVRRQGIRARSTAA